MILGALRSRLGGRYVKVSGGAGIFSGDAGKPHMLGAGWPVRGGVEAVVGGSLESGPRGAASSVAEMPHSWANCRNVRHKQAMLPKMASPTAAIIPARAMRGLFRPRIGFAGIYREKGAGKS